MFVNVEKSNRQNNIPLHRRSVNSESSTNEHSRLIKIPSGTRNPQQINLTDENIQQIGLFGFLVLLKFSL